MNAEKARELFSEYYENSLDNGLRQSLELVLERDAELRKEYEFFKKTMDDLSTFPEENIDIPHDLHDRILARIDGRLEAKKASLLSQWSVWTKGGAIAALAAAAAFFAVVQMRPSDSVVNTAGPNFPTVSPKVQPETIKVAATPTGAELRIKAQSEKKLTVSGMTGQVLNSQQLNKGDDLVLPLDNNQQDAVWVVAQLGEEPIKHVIAIPGKDKLTLTAGEGTIADFGKAVAGFYQVIVVMDVKSVKENVKWKFAATDASGAVAEALDSQKHVVEHDDSGVVRIYDK